jgi:ATP-dependent Zn proteases
METQKNAFDMIIGYESIKQELKQICDVILHPEIYSKFDITVPNGLLLSGAPGVGKSLMAKCLCDESKRPTYIIRKNQSNGDFIKEMQQIFCVATNNAPSIVVLDDMDKFANEDKDHPNAEEYVAVQACIDEVKNKNVFVIATVNDTDKLPDSLKRAGRFDRQISVLVPSFNDSKKIIKHYLQKKMYIGNDINIDEIAGMMYERSCADLERVINEAGIYAAYKRKNEIQYEDFIEAFLRISYNSSKSIDNRDEKINREVAYHEVGHAVVSEILEPNSISLVSIAAYESGTRGITVYYRDEKYWNSFARMEHRIMMLLAGRISVELNLGNYDIGANNDYERATAVIKRMVEEYDIYGTNEYHFWDYKRSNETNDTIAVHIRSKLEEYAFKARTILVQNKAFVDKMAALLLEKETITGKEVKKIKAELI